MVFPLNNEDISKAARSSTKPGHETLRSNVDIIESIFSVEGGLMTSLEAADGRIYGISDSPTNGKLMILYIPGGSVGLDSFEIDKADAPDIDAREGQILELPFKDRLISFGPITRLSRTKKITI